MQLRVLSCGICRSGLRVGVPWLGWTCGICEQCRAGRENLCPNARFTRPGDGTAQEFALQLGATWAGPSDACPPVALDAAIVVAPVTRVVRYALEDAHDALADLRAGRFSGAGVLVP